MSDERTPEQKAAAAWLVLAYSLGHKDDCQCEHCPKARDIVFGLPWLHAKVS